MAQFAICGPGPSRKRRFQVSRPGFLGQLSGGVKHMLMDYIYIYVYIYIYTLWLFNIAMENGPFIDGLPIENGDFPWLC